MFVPRSSTTVTGRRVPRPLRTKHGQPVDTLYFDSQRALLKEREQLEQTGMEPLEADVKPTQRFLMERFIQGGFSVTGRSQSLSGALGFRDPSIRAAEVIPKLKTLSIDIETDGWEGPVLSVALVGAGLEHVYVARDGTSAPGVTFHGTERATLEAVFAAIREFDPDAILGWNVVDFDLRALDARCLSLGIPFAIGRLGDTARVLVGETPQSVSIARVPGRVVLDGVATLRNASWTFERYGLDFVAKELLGRGKLRAEGVDALAEIRRLFRDDPLGLAAYNLEDARLALEIFEKAELVEFLVERSRLTGLLLDRQGGSVAAFDYLYLPKLHRRGVVAPSVGNREPSPSPGGHVLESVPGLFRNVASFDFRSLYPSIIRTFHVDPLALWEPGVDPIPGFEGASFAREGALLPELITHLHQERTRARQAGNETLSRAVKILMNSFYGVLGTPGCRFFDPRLASSITRRGHEIIERSRKYFEDQGLQVLYGDTDSLFVRLDERLDEATARREGERLATEVNAFWREHLQTEFKLPSHLELRFDVLFLRFLMPTMRGSDRGSKKRYAGWVRKGDGVPELLLRGLEAVRTDWTPLARSAQCQILERVFTDQAWEPWLHQVRSQLLAGHLDDQLVYRKRLRREVDAYAAAPPHVRAAKRLAEAEESEDNGSATDVSYVMTVRGPEPVGLRESPIDYAHYLERQLAPAVDVVLALLGTSFDRVAGNQLQLFP